MAIYVNGKKVAGLGAPGKSPYQIAVEGGYTGTEQEFNQALANGGLPSGGSNGQVVAKGADGAEWKTLSAADVGAAKERSRVQISVPTSGWTDNKQTFTVNGVPSDPTTYEVHLAEVGETNVAAAMACGLYIADEGQNSLTLAVSSVPETAFQVYAVIEPF